MAKLRHEIEVLAQGHAGERTVVLEDGVHTLGRGGENRISLVYASVSRHHALLYIDGAKVYVEDLDSKNGTFIDDKRVYGRAPLLPGQLLRCGDVRMKFHRTVMYPSPAVAVPMPEAVRVSGGVSLGPAPIDLWYGESAQTLKGGRIPSPVASRSAEEKLRILLKVAEIFGQATTRTALYERIVDLAVQIIEADRGALLLAVDGTPDLEPAYTRSDGAGSPNELCWSRSVVQWVHTQQQAGLFSDTLLDQRVADSESILLQRVAAALAAPLVVGDRFLGVLYVDHRTMRGRYADADLELLCAFANQAAVAIENARLRDQVENEAVTRNALMRFFPPNTVGRLGMRPTVGIEPTDTVVTALFADICGYTELSERLAPRELVALLNRYFPVVSEIVFRLDGTLEKYIGDALLAVWGAPFRKADDAQRAVQAAVEMQRATAALSADLPEPIRIHIGLHTGPVCAANIGSEAYLQFATIGDATNLASRVCSLAGAGEILMSDDTRAALDEPVEVDDRGTTQVKGRQQPVKLWRVVR
jgi:adenylate cyclase